MAGGKETPRQRMIGILYLVLLGLIALNVPDSLLDAFKNITDSLDASRKNVSTSIDNTYTAFEKTKLIDEPERAKKPYAEAQQATRIVKNLNDYIETLKKTLIDEGGGINATIGDVSARDNLDISPRIMINQGNAEILKKKIDDTRAQLLALLGKDKANVNFSLNTTDPPARAGISRTWPEAYFGDGIPLGATLTTLAKIQADAKNAENETVKKLLGKVDKAVVNLDQFNAVAVAPTSYVLQGQPYTAEVFLTAYDSKANPIITIDGSKIPVTNGKGTYTVNTSSEGIHTWTGTILVKQADGTSKPYTIPTQTYQVAKPSAVVSPDKMNVLYIGVPNPVSLSAPGIAKEKVKASISGAGGSLSPTAAGHYTAMVSSIGEATISVSGDIGGGKMVPLGSTKFRVKRIPDPKPQFAGKSGGNTNTANVKAQDKIFARLEGFDFDAQFVVTRFTLLVIKPRQDPVSFTANGADLTSAMHTAINSITPGATLVFKDIIAVGPDHTQRGLDPIVLSAN